MGTLDRVEAAAAELHRRFVLGRGLLVPRMTGVRTDHRQQRRRGQRGRKLGQEAVKRRPAEGEEAAVVTCQNDIHAIEQQLEVQGAAGILRLTPELAALHVHADQQPAEDTDDRADDARHDPIDIHHDTSSNGDPCRAASVDSCRAIPIWHRHAATRRSPHR